MTTTFKIWRQEEEIGNVAKNKANYGEMLINKWNLKWSCHNSLGGKELGLREPSLIRRGG